jgi:ribosomal protein L16/L10AE
VVKTQRGRGNPREGRLKSQIAEVKPQKMEVEFQATEVKLPIAETGVQTAEIKLPPTGVEFYPEWDGAKRAKVEFQIGGMMG